MTYIMSCVWLDYMVKYFQCKNCVGSSPKTKKCVASFLVPGDKKTSNSINVGCSFLLLMPNISKYEVRSANAQIPFDNKD